MLTDSTWILWKTLLLILLCYCTFVVFKHLWGRRYLFICSVKVPGPFTLPYIGKFFIHSNPQEMVSEISNLADSYKGEICKLWLGTDLYFILSDPQHIEIVATHANCVNKGKFAENANIAFGDGLATALEQKWRSHKKILLPVFFKRNLENFMEIFAKKADSLVLNLEKYSESGEVVPARFLYYHILQMVSATLLGVDMDIGILKSGLGEAMKRLLQIQFLRMFTTVYSWKWLFNFTIKAQEVKICLKIIHEQFDKLMDEMKDQSASSDGFTADESTRISLQNYLPKNVPGETDLFTKSEFRDEVMTILIAGTDTNTVTVGMTLIALGIYPKIQKKVYDEVITVIGPIKNIEAADLSKLKYTEMVMKESLRYFNPIYLVFRKAEADITLGSTFIPRNSHFIISLKSVHFNPEYWPNPLKYDPERFSPDKTRNPYTFIPFSSGLRPCIGEKFAYFLVKTLIASIIRRYEVFTDYKSLQEVEYRNDFVISPKGGYKLRIRKRDSVLI